MGRRMPTRLRKAQVSGLFCINNGGFYMSLATFYFKVATLFGELATFSIEVAIWGKKFPHFPYYFPHFPYIIGYARLAKLLYGTLLLGCKLNIILMESGRHSAGVADT